MSATDAAYITRVRNQRQVWAAFLIIGGLVAGAIGGIGYHLSKRDGMDYHAQKAVQALACIDNPEGAACTEKISDGQNPAWLVVGLGAGGAMLLVGVVLLATRPPALASPDTAPPMG